MTMVRPNACFCVLLALVVLCLARSVANAKRTWKPLKRETYLKNGVWTVPLHVTEPSGVDRENWPVTSGIPIPRGALRSIEQLELLGPDGKERDLQARATAHWPDGSIKWVLLDFQTTVKAKQTAVCQLAFPRKQPREAQEGVRASAEGAAFNSGAVRLRVRNGQFAFLSADVMGLAGPVAEKGDASVELGDVAGKSLGTFLASRSAPVKWEVEEPGPLRVVFKTTGWHALGERKTIPYHLRVEAYRGHRFVRVYHTFIVSEDPNKTTIREMGLRLPLALDTQKLRCTVGTPEPTEFSLGKGGKSAYLLHSDWDRFVVSKPDGSREQCDGAARWVDLSDGEKGVTVCVRDMERMFPKELEISADPPAITNYVWPKHLGKALDMRHQLVNPSPDMLEFQKNYPRLFRLSEHGGMKPAQAIKRYSVETGRCAMGLAVTHECLYYFHEGGCREAKSAEMARAFNRRLIAYVTPQWYCGSEAFGKIHPHDAQNFPLAEEHLSRTIDWAIRHQNEWSHWYGMLNYGDTQTRRDLVKGQWGRFCGRFGWLNTEVEAHHCAFIQYVRTGKREYYDFAEAMSRHHMDVDTISWHVNKAFVGMSHRHDIDHWGGSLGASHGWLNGYMDHYYLSGYQRAFEVSRDLKGEYFLGEPLRSCLTGNAQREAVDGWWGLMRLWEATGEERYKKACDDVAKVYLKLQRSDGLWDRLHMGYMCQTTPTWYWISGSQDCATIMLNLERIMGGVLANALGNPAPYYAYQYWLSKDVKYLIRGYREMYGTGPKLGLLKKYTEPLGPESFVNARIVVLGGLPYFMAALYDAGVKGVDLDRYLPKPDEEERIKPLEGCDFVPLDLSGVVNRDPFREPFPLRMEAKLPANRAKFVKRFRPLKPGEIGLQFGGDRDPLAPGYHRITRWTLWPATPDAPVLSDNFYGLPFGAVATLGGVPFRLADPGRNQGRGVLILDKAQHVSIPVDMVARRVHFLGHVHRYADFRALDDLADFDVARYIIHYSDGTTDEIPLKNLTHFENLIGLPAAREVRLARPGRYYGLGSLLSHGSWLSHVNLFTFSPKPKTVDRIEFVDSGRGCNPALLAVTVEREKTQAPEAEAEPIRFLFGAQAQGVSGAARYKPGGMGWVSGDGLKDALNAVALSGDNTFRANVEPGTYSVTLKMAASGTPNMGLNLMLQGERRLFHALMPKGSPQEFTFDTRIPDGVLDVGFSRSGFNRLDKRPAMVVQEITLRPLPPAPKRPAAPAAPTPKLSYGWDNYGRLSPSRLYLGLVSPFLQRQQFRVALPNGRYAIELMMTAHFAIHNLYVDVTVEDKKVLDSQFMRTPKVYKFETEVTDGVLDMTIPWSYGRCEHLSEAT